ncbi:hypothetical protein DFH09DRAFT_1336578 [Mycena vulgaris]|nr:hypothetical protein DFH09DRAFT_1336578 [Mycena vulgaris]
MLLLHYILVAFYGPSRRPLILECTLRSDIDLPVSEGPHPRSPARVKSAAVIIARQLHPQVCALVRNQSVIMGGHEQKKRKAIRQNVYDRAGKKQRKRQAIVANQFFFIPELFVGELLYHVDLITIMILAHTCQYARDLVKAFFSCNLRLVIAQFIGEHNVKPVYDILEVSRSAMAGSVISSVVTAPYRHPHNKWSPTSLNVFLPRGFMLMWTEFFDALGFPVHPADRDAPTVDGENGVDSKFKHAAVAHVIYNAMPGFTIQLTESIDVSVLTPLVAGTNTWGACLATVSDIYVVYKDLVARKRSVEGWFPTPVKKAVVLGRRGIRNSFSTASWERPCGLSCPVLWREIRGLKGVGIFRWGGPKNQYADGVSTVGIPCTDTDVKWRLGDTCTNRNCLWKGASYNGFGVAPES